MPDYNVSIMNCPKCNASMSVECTEFEDGTDCMCFACGFTEGTGNWREPDQESLIVSEEDW